MRQFNLVLAILVVIGSANICKADERVECATELWGVCVLEIRRESQAEKDEDLRRWWECVKLGMPGDTAHQDRCEEIVYGTGTTPDSHELRR